MLFELIQVALGNRENLSSVSSAEEWNNLFLEAQRQSVVGVTFEGLQKLPQEQWPPQLLLLQWIGYGQQIKQRNAVLNDRCVELLSRLASAGLHPTILKGQGLAKYYSSALQDQRQAGDIDVYVSDGREKAIDYAKSTGQEEIEWDYKHLHLKVWDDTEIELHYHVEVLLSPWKNKKLQHWFKDNESLLYCSNGKLVTPTQEMNVFYVLLHIYRHFFTEGIGLRQLLDYYFVLKASKGVKLEYSNGEIIEDVLKTFGMWKFAKGIMWIMQEVFALERDYMFCEPSESEGRFIMDRIMEGGNFGHYQQKTHINGLGKLNTLISVTTNNLGLIRRYPSEALASPFWYVWHKGWKLTR
jgi:hypothetical protein